MSTDPFAPRLSWPERIRRMNYGHARDPLPVFKSDEQRLADLRARHAAPGARPFDGGYSPNLPWNNEATT